MSKRTGSVVSRRVALKGAAALAATSALLPFAARAQAPGKRIVLSTWGGDYAKLLTKHVSAPAMAPKGWEVVNDEAQVVQRKAKTLAEKRLPVGTSDVQALTATDVAEMAASDTLEKLDLSKLKNAGNIIKTFSIAEFSAFLTAHLQRQSRPL